MRKIILFIIIFLLFCFTVYAGFETDTATFDVVAIQIKADVVTPPVGYIYIYSEPSDNDLKAKNATGDVVTIADFP